MPFLAKLFGRLVFCLGVMITVVGFVVGSLLGASGGATMSGVTLMAVGAAIYWIGSTKLCPQCSKRIKYTAVECKHCGSDLSGRTI
jgi:hypothetical protein